MQKKKKDTMFTRLFESINEVYFCINVNWSPTLKAGLGSKIGIWLGVKWRKESIFTPLAGEDKKESRWYYNGIENNFNCKQKHVIILNDIKAFRT